MKGWKTVIDLVHAKGTKIFVQLFHAGRGTHPLKINGLEPWAPSAIAIR
jgi:N-ethylmaleimide reductase